MAEFIRQNIVPFSVDLTYSSLRIFENSSNKILFLCQLETKKVRFPSPRWPNYLNIEEQLL